MCVHRKKNLTIMKEKKSAMKQDERGMCLRLHENTNDSHNMFEGYYGRRRLKTTVALFLAFLILAVLFYRRQSKILII